jgi:hypothetical protein
MSSYRSNKAGEIVPLKEIHTIPDTSNSAILFIDNNIKIPKK